MLPKFLCWLLTFNAVNIAWIFFRANSFDSAMNVVKAMFDVNRLVVPHSYAFKYSSKILVSSQDMISIIGCLIVSVIAFDKKYIERINVNIVAIVISMFLLYSVLCMGQVTEFLYFQF